MLAVLAAVVSAGCGRLTPVPSTPTTTAPAPLERPKSQFGGRANLLVNPSFELGAKPWTALSDTKAAVSHAVSRFGRSSLAVSALKAMPYGVSLITAVASPAVGDRYRFSAWFYSPSHPQRVTVTLQGSNYARTEAHPEIVATTTQLVGSHWTRISVAGVITRAHRTSLDVFVSVSTSIAPDVAFYMDGAALAGGPR